MATLARYKEKKVWAGEAQKEMIRVVYSFAADGIYAADGGAVGALDVFKAKNAMVVHSAYMEVLTTCTSGGSATVSLGISGDAAGLVAATAVASLTAGAVIGPEAFDASFKLAADAVVQMAIGTAALTAGKIAIVLEVSAFG